MDHRSSFIALTSVSDGELITSTLYATKPLIQRLKVDTDKAIPDWSVKENHPVIYPRAKSQSVGKRLAIINPVWSYNGVKIENNPKFEITTYDDGGLVVPALKIVDNLISLDNLNADTITFEGEAIYSKETYPIHITTDIQLEEMVGEAYDAFIEVTNAGVITEGNDSVTCTAILYKGGAEVTNDISYKWFKSSKDGFEEIKSDTGTPNKLTIKEADVDSELVIKVEFYVKNVLVYSKAKQISDETDTLFIHVQEDGSRTLKPNKSITLTPSIRNRVTGEELTGYNYIFRTFDNMMKQIAETEAKSLTISFEQVEKNNKYIGLIIIAYK